MSEKKSITIASGSLIGGGGGGSKRKSSRRGSGSGEHKIRPSSIVQPSTLKKTLLERIKQHQRTRERSREHRDDDSKVDDNHTTSTITASPADDNFTQSIDFLRKLAMKRRQQQHTPKHPHSSSSSSSSSGMGLPEAKTPEAKMLNQFAATLHNGEILTNTGLLGLPVVPTMVLPVQQPQQQYSASPMISLDPMPMPMLMQSSVASASGSGSEFTNNTSFPPIHPPVAPPPNITQLADMYNNTIASTDSATPLDVSAKDPPLHIPTKPEDYLPSIFIKQEPPHGCLKNGTKPTFREWATNMLKKPVDTIKNMIGGGTPSDDGGAFGERRDGASGGGTSGGGTSSEQHRSDDINGMGSNRVNPEQVAGMRVKIRKTHKKRFRIGKHDDVVGVLLKNKQTQRHIQSQHLTLKQKTIGEIRKYLYDHHLLKIGSNAPPDVLRRMYEDSILTGDVKNTNNDVLLHNFMSGGGGGGE